MYVLAYYINMFVLWKQLNIVIVIFININFSCCSFTFNIIVGFQPNSFAHWAKVPAQKPLSDAVTVILVDTRMKLPN